jgi:Ribbon-helix-helix domain
MRGNKFIENAVRWRVFHRAVREARAAVADILPSELQKMIDEAVEEIRARNQRTPSVNYNP